MIRTLAGPHAAGSVIELGDARHVIATAAPRTAGSLHAQAHDALQTIREIMEEGGVSGSILQQTVFIADVDQIEPCRQIVDDFYGDQPPATVYVPQPPCGGRLLEIEVQGVGGKGDIAIQRYPGEMVVCHHDDATWVHLAGVSPRTTDTGVYPRSLDAFQTAGRRLAARGFAFDQVIRTWLYLGDIVGTDGNVTRYQELNRARTDFYRDIRFGAGLTPPGSDLPVFPASTGIGALGNDLTLSALALAAHRDDVVLLPLENPEQTSAFDYGHQFGPCSPKFARAMAVAAGEGVALFISGTASITRSETQFIGDVEGQTRQTLDNIEALIGHDNFRRQGMPGVGATLEDFALARVYVKRPEDYAAAKAVCAARLGDVPTVYAVADVCRPELLVEIEGIAFTGRAG